MLDQFFDLPLSRRVLAYGFLILLLIILYYFFLHLPGSALIVEKQTKIETLEEEKVKLLATLKGREALKAEIREDRSPVSRSDKTATRKQRDSRLAPPSLQYG